MFQSFKFFSTALAFHVGITSLCAQSFIHPQNEPLAEDSKTTYSLTSPLDKPLKASNETQKKQPLGPKNLSTSVFEWNPKYAQTTGMPKPITENTPRRKFHYAYINQIQPKKSLFFQTNIGLGLLYFGGVKGNMAIQPGILTQFGGDRLINEPIRGRLSYNRTPLFEYVVGRRFNSIVKAGLSYQTQSGVTLQTKQYATITYTPQLTMNFALNSIMAKAYLESPRPLSLYPMLISPYLGVGAGVVWQSWSNILEVLYIFNEPSTNQAPRADPIYYSNVTSASAAFSIDIGLRAQRFCPNLPISFTLGTKFNYWGQARNIGNIKNQKNFKVGLFKPFNIRSVYQWAPYLGAQWNFAPVWKSTTPYKIQGKPINTWAPFFTSLRQIETPNTWWTQCNVGPGILYFKNVAGLWRQRPIGFSQFVSANTNQVMNKTTPPLLEFLVGYSPLNWLRFALSFQNQSAISFSTGVLTSLENANNHNFVQLRANLNLNSLMLKNYFEVPGALIFKNLATSLYLAYGVGASWQTWNDVNVVYTIAPKSRGFYYRSNQITSKQKFIPNFAVMGDAGLRFQSAYPNSPYTILLGCKYNWWGQARNIALYNQQNSIKIQNIFFSIKYVQQVAPYMGFQWNFAPTVSCKAPFMLNGRATNTSTPYFVSNKALNQVNGIWTSFNAGASFLYFSGVKGNLTIHAQTPLAVPFGYRNIAFKGRLSCNPAPIYEYLAGLSVGRWLNVGLSFQHMGNVIVQTEGLQSLAPSTGPLNSQSMRTQLRSNLSLNGFAIKFKIKSPVSLVGLNLATTPYFSFGGGFGWQSWTRTFINYMGRQPNFQVDCFTYSQRQTISANGIVSCDLGLDTRSALPLSRFGFQLGCRFNLWGQAMNIGAYDRKGSQNYGIFKAFTIQSVYQWAPYGGVQWNF